MFLINVLTRGALAFVAILCVGLLSLQMQAAGGAAVVLAGLVDQIPPIDSLTDVSALKAQMHSTINWLLG